MRYLGLDFRTSKAVPDVRPKLFGQKVRGDVQMNVYDSERWPRRWKLKGYVTTARQMMRMIL